MKESVFPDIDGAFTWYIATKDGLRGLRAAIQCGAVLSEDIGDELYGMTLSEWQDDLRRQTVKHGVFATLALFAACEGGIRRDFEWRAMGEFGQTHAQRFRKLQLQAGDNAVPLNNILTGWIGAEGDKAWLRQRLLQLLTLFRQRNDLAHGRIAEDVAVERVYDLLCRIREKWCAAVPDFRGF
jgi:hypothetical protein